MKVLQRYRRLAGCATVILGLTSLAVPAAAPAQARVAATPVASRVVASWGDNTVGQLGDGTTVLRTLFHDIAAGRDVVQVAGGRVHGLALRSDGTVWAWGQNDHGQLGRGIITSEGVAPARVAVLNHVTKISAGRKFGLALRSDGIVFAWGAGQFGQLGNGATADSPVPVKIAGLAQVTGISAGSDAALATEASAISAVTSVWAWGNNDEGQLGDGTTISHPTPGRVTGLPVSIAGISAGNQFAAVLGPDGSVWGWGSNVLGQLDIAPAGSAVTRPVNIIAAGSRITQISAGGAHMLALRSDGTVLGWGLNVRGQLGNGTQSQVTGAVEVTNMGGATQVAAGTLSSYAVHTVLVLSGQSS